MPEDIPIVTRYTGNDSMATRLMNHVISSNDSIANQSGDQEIINNWKDDPTTPVPGLIRSKVSPESYYCLQKLIEIHNTNQITCSDLTPRLVEWMKVNSERVPDKVAVMIIDHISECSLCKGRVQGMSGRKVHKEGQ